MMSVKQILHISSTTRHPEWNLSVAAARRPFSPHAARCRILALDVHMKVRSLLQKRGWWKDEDRREDSIVFLPRCHSGSYVTVLCICLLPASCCHSAFLIHLPFLAPRPSLPSFSINPVRPKEAPLSLLFILSQTPGIISFPTSCFFTLDTICQCFSHLWPYFYQPFRTLLQAKAISGLILVQAGPKHTTHDRTFPVKKTDW